MIILGISWKDEQLWNIISLITIKQDLAAYTKAKNFYCKGRSKKIQNIAVFIDKCEELIEQFLIKHETYKKESECLKQHVSLCKNTFDSSPISQIKIYTNQNAPKDMYNWKLYDIPQISGPNSYKSLFPSDDYVEQTKIEVHQCACELCKADLNE